MSCRILGHTLYTGFKPPEPNDSPDEPEILYGDLNNDNIVNSSDAALLSRYVLEIIDEFPGSRKTADLNGDGVVNSVDYTILQRYLLEIITKFPVEDN